MRWIPVLIQRSEAPREEQRLEVQLTDDERELRFTLEQQSYRLLGHTCFSVLSQFEQVLRKNGYTAAGWPESESGGEAGPFRM